MGRRENGRSCSSRSSSALRRLPRCLPVVPEHAPDLPTDWNSRAFHLRTAVPHESRRASKRTRGARTRGGPESRPPTHIDRRPFRASVPDDGLPGGGRHRSPPRRRRVRGSLPQLLCADAGATFSCDVRSPDLRSRARRVPAAGLGAHRCARVPHLGSGGIPDDGLGPPLVRSPCGSGRRTGGISRDRDLVGSLLLDLLAAACARRSSEPRPRHPVRSACPAAVGAPPSGEAEPVSRPPAPRVW